LSNVKNIRYEGKCKKINTQLARVPQDMTFDTDAMNMQFQRQAGLIRDVFIFIQTPVYDYRYIQ
jgi:hypothetical protein